MRSVTDLPAYAAARDAAEAELVRACGVGRFTGARVVEGRVVVSTSLDDEAMTLEPAAARTLGLMLRALADTAEGREAP